MHVRNKPRSNTAITLSLSAIKITFIVMISLITIAARTSASPTDYYVDPVNGSNNNDGLSTTTPLLTLTFAMGVKASPGDTIYLFPGTYKEEHTDHPDGQHPPDYSCNKGEPEDFPIYLKENVTIRKYEGIPGEAILSTVDCCNEDILRVYVRQMGGSWMNNSEADLSQIIGITFKTKNWGDWKEGSG